MRSDEKHAHELSGDEWREITSKIARGQRVIGEGPVRPELPDAREITDAEFERALDNLTMRRI